MRLSRLILLLLLPSLASAEVPEVISRQPLERATILPAVANRIAPAVLLPYVDTNTAMLCYGLIDDKTGQPVLLSISPLTDATNTTLYLDDNKLLTLAVKRKSLVEFSIELTFSGHGLIKSMGSRKVSVEQLADTFGSTAVDVDRQPMTLFFLTQKADALLELRRQAALERIHGTPQ